MYLCIVMQMFHLPPIGTLYSSPIGPLMIESDGTHIVSLRPFLPIKKGRCPTEGSPAEPSECDEATAECIRWLDKYFSGCNPGFLPPLQLEGTPFQKRVWEELLRIPYGHTTTYGAIAKSIAEKMSPQAVGQAVGRNPAAIVVPCHRVVGAGGKLTGYAYGVDMKQRLLEMEGVLLPLTNKY